MSDIDVSRTATALHTALVAYEGFLTSMRSRDPDSDMANRARQEYADARAAVEAAARHDCRAAQEPLAEALRTAQEHLRELREAWERGIIREGDTLGGTRSNRNVDVLLAISKALAAYDRQAAP